MMTLLIVWCVASIPAGIIVGRILRDKGRRDAIEQIADLCIAALETLEESGHSAPPRSLERSVSRLPRVQGLDLDGELEELLRQEGN